MIEQPPARNRAALPNSVASQSCALADNASGKRASTVRSGTLFGGRRQVQIEHDGHVYLLRITQNNKLILTK